MFQPVLVTLSSKSDPLWRDYEQQCLNESQASVTAGAGPNLISPASFSSSQNPKLCSLDKIIPKTLRQTKPKTKILIYLALLKEISAQHKIFR